MSETLNINYLKFIKNSGISFFLQNEPNNFYKTKSNKINSIFEISIENIKNIDDLNLFIENSHNKSNANEFVLGEGNENANIMVIGEPPILEEEKAKKPFVGSVGNLLEKMLNSISIKREKIYLTNIMPWRPLNKNYPNNEELIDSLPIIQRMIELINPKLILLLGKTPSKAILNSNIDIEQLRGKWHNYKSINNINKILCLATYHPSTLIELPAYKKESWEDLKMFKKKIIDENI